MAWVIGIDEAGYGPNLGPMVQSAIAMRVTDPTANLWQQLKTIARRAEEDADDRLAIDDSKAVYGASSGLARLEEGVLTVFNNIRDHQFTDWLRIACVYGHEDLICETWFVGEHSFPIEAEAGRIQACIERWLAALREAGINMATPCCVVTPAPKFNSLLSTHGSKGAIACHGLIELIRACFERADEELFFTIDKLGGRNFYAAII